MVTVSVYIFVRTSERKGHRSVIDRHLVNTEDKFQTIHTELLWERFCCDRVIMPFLEDHMIVCLGSAVLAGKIARRRGFVLFTFEIRRENFELGTSTVQ